MKIEPGTSLSWVQPIPTQRHFELMHGNSKLLSLSWTRDGGTLAEVRSDDENWTFKRGGFLQPRITARKGEIEVASFEPGASGNGVVHLASGHLFRWSSNLWRGEWTWVNAAGKTGIKTRREFSIDTRQGTVEVMPDGIPRLEVPLLIVLGWYIIILLSEEGTAP